MVDIDSMGLTKSIVTQARKPTGKFGKVFARIMNTGHSQLTQWGLSHISIGQNPIALDVGCGGGKTINLIARIATKGKVYGIDYSETSVAVATSINKKYIDAGQVGILHASVQSLPFPDNMFDLVTAIESYYFWPDVINNLRGIRHILKPGGSVVLINESYRNEKFEKRNSNWAKAGNFNYHSPVEFESFLKEANYSQIRIEVLESKNWILATGIK
jgi:ubiquinone/menaquinone biosynthesis C-methylase UbiE